MIQPLFFYLLDLLTRKSSRVWSSLINFVDKFMSEESSCQQEEGIIIKYGFQDEMCLEI